MSNEVQVQKLTDIMAQFVGFTAKKLPDDVIAKLEELRAKEDSPMAKVIYDTMFRNRCRCECRLLEPPQRTYRI